MSYPTYRKGETVIVHDGTRKRDSIELAEVAEDSGYHQDYLYTTYGHFKTKVSKDSVHKAPSTLKKALKN